MAAAVNEEKVIQQRLLFKEVQLKKFLNKYLELAFNYDKLDSTETDNIAQEILGELELLEFQIHKAEMNYSARDKDLSYHMNLCDKIESSIGQTHKEIEELRSELTIREKKKRSKFEYEVIANEINQYENPEVIKSQADKIQTEIDELTEKNNEQMQKIQNKERQLYQLIYAINEFQDINLNEENEKKVT